MASSLHELAKALGEIDDRLQLIETLFHKRNDGQMSLNIATGLKLSDGENLTQLFSDVKGGQTLTFPNESARLVGYAIHKKNGPPNGGDIPNGTWAVFMDTGTYEISIWVNDGGTFKSVKFTSPQI